MYHITNTPQVRTLQSPRYNYLFRKSDGFFARWGETKQHDPEYSPFGPEIADIEISTVCHGVGCKPCSFCYKSNTARGHNMRLDTFKRVFTALPPTVTQIAFGIGDIDANPDLWAILRHCREYDVVPNITINGDRMTDEHYQRLASLCGAVAVSHYNDDV